MQKTLHTPPWLCQHGTRLAPVSARMTADALILLKRIRRFRGVLHRPDAWVCPFSRQLKFEPPSEEDTHKYLPLAIGDCVHYTQVLHMPFVTHDMVYVGLGCVVGFQRRGSGSEPAEIADDNNGCVQLDRLDIIKVAGNRLLKSESGGQSMLSREAVATRALLSLGWYKYGGTDFNCQHVYELILGNRSFSLGLIRMLAIFIPTTTVLYFFLLLGVSYLLFCRNGSGR